MENVCDSFPDGGCSSVTLFDAACLLRCSRKLGQPQISATYADKRAERDGCSTRKWQMTASRFHIHNEHEQIPCRFGACNFSAWHCKLHTATPSLRVQHQTNVTGGYRRGDRGCRGGDSRVLGEEGVRSERAEAVRVGEVGGQGEGDPHGRGHHRGVLAGRGECGAEKRDSKRVSMWEWMLAV